MLLIVIDTFIMISLIISISRMKKRGEIQSNVFDQDKLSNEQVIQRLKLTYKKDVSNAYSMALSSLGIALIFANLQNAIAIWLGIFFLILDAVIGFIWLRQTRKYFRKKVRRP